MININGNFFSNLDSLDIKKHIFIINNTNFCEEIHFENGLLFFWEYHFFRIMASLRRLRFEIPVSFNKDFLEKEVIRTINTNNLNKKSINVKFNFYSNLYKKNVDYIIYINESKSYDKIISTHSHLSDIYNEELINPGLLSNLSITNKVIREIANIYAIENGIDSCIILNNKKNIVESTRGTIYLIKKNKIITPNLLSGCQNTAIRSSFNDWINKQKTNFILEEININVYELQQCNELFLLSINQGYTSVSKYRKTFFLNNKGGKIFKDFISSI